MSKVTLITGAASGFGYKVTQKLVEAGHIVYGADIKPVEGIESDNFHPIIWDVRDYGAGKVLVDRIISEQGRIDILANNAGYGIYDLIESANIDAVRNMFEVNFWALTMLSRAVLPHMRKARSGRIVNTSSCAGLMSGPLMGWYSASKFAVEGFSDALRLEAGLFGIKVSLIEPGTFKTGYGGTVQNHFKTMDHPDDYNKLVNNFVTSYAERQKVAPTPEPIVEAILDAILSDNPKIRYIVGEDGKALVKARTELSNEEFDNMVRQSLDIE